VPWIHVDDAAGVFLHLVDASDARGRFNAVAPGVISNREFTEAFARHVRRPVVWSVPAGLVRAVVGRERASILLEGQNVIPRRTLEAGYRFRYPALDEALTDLVHVTF
jgi:NAD dependent epimerase/dehydratase family enzyme